MKLTSITIAILIVPLLLTGCSPDSNSNSATSAKPPATAEAEASGIPSASAAPSVSEDLRIDLVKHDKGFSFPLQISEGVNGFVAQTFPAPNDPNLVAHLVKRRVYDPEGIRYRLDVVAVKPKEQTYSLYPVADLIVKDDYSVDSITGAYGFTEQDQLVLVQPKKREDGQEGIQYDVVALDLYNGRLKTIAANAVPDVSPSFFAKGWMNKSGQLYLNSYSDGRLWSVDVLTGKIQSIEGQFKHEWPLYLVTPSPDGNLFWHEQTDSFRLYDRNGKELKVIPPTLGYHSYPAFEWSPDSRFAALSFTLSDSHDNVLGGEEAYIIAPEAIAFYDERGDLTWDVQAKPKEGLTHVDWNGWLADGDEGVLSWYRLNRTAEGAPRKADSSYGLANVATGKITKLTQAKQLEELKSPMPVIVNHTAPMMIIDREQGLYWMPAETTQADSSIRYQLLSKPTDTQLIWSAYDYQSEHATITRYNPVNHATSITAFNEPLGDGLQLIGDTLIVDNKMNYRAIH
ncbi:hypothetical protein [Paenibacillus sp. JDR-2]|uniref:hypothetical protein n=1 Tax=Paenibacillus sp. (strain JDR-2) TaxID=324057 RepID=UPI000166A7C8|nr:hypothetical protein [Paenibacillus sp. JDR-2]ACT00027.1 hypothetical protein Pjdr2_1351 [Paenibacillus sp. JDR-2]